MKVVIFLLGTALALTLASNSPLQVKLNRGIPLHSKSRKSVGTEGIGAEGRLPGDVTPLEYDIQLAPILEAIADQPAFVENNVYGYVEIKIQAVNPVSRITLNAFESVAIAATSIRVTHENLNEDPFDNTLKGEGDPKKEFYYIDLLRATQTANLEAGNVYTISMKFVSKIHTTPDHLYGIYRTTFPTDAGVPSVMATTQFEPTGAREAFPCFDEPALKAKFRVSIGHNPDTHTVLGNDIVTTAATPIVTLPTGWELETFKESQMQSTYLVAFVVSKTAEYTCVTANDTEVPVFGKTVQVCGPKHLVSSDGRNGGEYPAKQSLELLKHFQSDAVTGMPYHLQKMDSVVIPDFDAGAMENWGLNTYRIELLMCYPGETTEARRLRITQVLAHELIHQWFGNTETCKFWDQIWMNEGFANFFEYYGVDHVEDGKAFKSLELRQFESVQYALEFDATSDTHPVINNVPVSGSTFKEFQGAFTGISYEKAGTLLRMLQEWIGADIFKEDLKVFLKEFEFDPVTQNDLFGNLTRPVDSPYTVKEVMNTWTLQSGFPLLRVSKSGNERILISQERFKPAVEYSVVQDDGSLLDPNELWTIPLLIATPPVESNPGQNVISKEWLHKADGMKSIVANAANWVLINPDGNGFYRVLYDTPLFKALVAQLAADRKVFPVVARSQLIDDYFTFAAEGFARVENALKLTKTLGTGERSPVVWQSTFYHLSGFLSKLMGGNQDAYTQFSRYMTSRLTEVFVDFQLEQPVGAKGGDVILRSQLVDWACTLKMENCLKYARDSFNKWIDPQIPVPIPVDVRSSLLCSAVAQSQTNYDAAFIKYKASTTIAEDKLRLVTALACTEIQNNINALLSEIVGGADIPDAHSSPLLSAIAGNTLLGLNSAIDYFLANDNTAPIIAMVKGEGIVDFYETLSNFVLPSEQIDSLEVVREDPALVAVAGRLSREIKKMRDNIVWRTKNEHNLKVWFEKENETA